MDDAFIDLRRNAEAGTGGDTFWPSFTDIMMVIVMIFMIACARPSRPSTRQKNWRVP
jgi:hypothetical protein